MFKNFIGEKWKNEGCVGPAYVTAHLQLMMWLIRRVRGSQSPESFNPYSDHNKSEKNICLSCTIRHPPSSVMNDSNLFIVSSEHLEKNTKIRLGSLALGSQNPMDLCPFSWCSDFKTNEKVFQ